MAWTGVVIVAVLAMKAGAGRLRDARRRSTTLVGVCARVQHPPMNRQAQRDEWLRPTRRPLFRMTEFHVVRRKNLCAPQHHDFLMWEIVSHIVEYGAKHMNINNLN